MMKDEIIAWFNSNQDYQTGIDLLERISPKQRMLGKLLKRGDTRSSREKLVYELNKIAGLKKVPKPSGKVMKRPVKVDKPVDVEEQEINYNLIKGKDIDLYPVEIRALVREYSGMYMKRGQLHTMLKKAGSANDADSISIRQSIIAEIEQLSGIMEVMHKRFSVYEKTGEIVPEKAENADQEDDETNDISKLSSTQLKALKKNLQTSKVKDQNIILYGTKTIPEDKKERPLPEGPRRIKLEKRVARKEQQIYDIDMLLAKMS